MKAKRDHDFMREPGFWNAMQSHPWLVCKKCSKRFRIVTDDRTAFDLIMGPLVYDGNNRCLHGDEKRAEAKCSGGA